MCAVRAWVSAQICLPGYGSHLEHVLHPRVELGQLRAALEVVHLGGLRARLRVGVGVGEGLGLGLGLGRVRWQTELRNPCVMWHALTNAGSAASVQHGAPPASAQRVSWDGSDSAPRQTTSSGGVGISLLMRNCVMSHLVRIATVSRATTTHDSRLTISIGASGYVALVLFDLEVLSPPQVKVAAHRVHARVDDVAVPVHHTRRVADVPIGMALRLERRRRWDQRLWRRLVRAPRQWRGAQWPSLSLRLPRPPELPGAP